MKPNPKTTFAVLALLSGGSTPWACESRGRIDDSPAGIPRPVSQPSTPGNANVAVLFEPWYETCDEMAPSPRDPAADNATRRHSGANDRAPNAANATGSFAIPSTAAYGWVAIRYTKGANCGLAKLYFDGRFVEPLELHAVGTPRQCERIYYLEDHSGMTHRIDAKVEGMPGSGNLPPNRDAYACLDSVVAGWVPGLEQSPGTHPAHSHTESDAAIVPVNEPTTAASSTDEIVSERSSNGCVSFSSRTASAQSTRGRS